MGASTSLPLPTLLAPLSFAYNFAAQQYGMFSSPNMLDVHDAHIAAFSPQPFFIAGFFFPQQIVQVVWLWKLLRAKERAGMSGAERGVMDGYAWAYVVGNVGIGTWMFFWNSFDLRTSNLFVIANTFTQLFYTAFLLPPLDTRSTPSLLTHLVAKTFAGIGVLDLLHNTSAAYYVGVPASGLVKALTGLGFGAAACVSDWIFGACLVYDLVALSVGQTQYGEAGWGTLLAGYAVGTAGIVGLRNWV